MRVAQSTRDGTARCLVCGWEGSGNTQPEVDRVIGEHLLQHDRIMVHPVYARNHDGRTPCLTAYHGRALSPEERRYERNLPVQAPAKRSLGRKRCL